MNDQMIEERDLTPKDNFKATFTVPYAAGILKAVGVDGGKPAQSSTLATAGPGMSIRLTADRKAIKADGQDLSFVTIEVVDKNGILQPNANQLITFKVKGFGTIQGLGNADMKSTDLYTGTECHLFHGKALIVVRSSKTPGDILINAQAPGLKPGLLFVNTK